MAQIKLNTIQIVLMAHYENLLIQIIHMAHICENDMIQIKDMFQIVATWLQFSTEEYLPSVGRPTTFIFTTAAQQLCFVTVVKIMNNQVKYYFHNRKTTGLLYGCCVPVVIIIFDPVFHYFHNRQYLAKICFEK